MDKEMTEREAFELAMGSVSEREGDGYYDREDTAAWLGWQAACKWQREKDAEICKGRICGAVQDNEWWAGFKSAMKQCSAAILNQGSKDETKP